MIRTSSVMRMAMLSVISAVIGLGGHCARAMLDGFNGGSNGQRQSKAQDRPKRP
jgi:hypothetical protein